MGRNSKYPEYRYEHYDAHEDDKECACCDKKPAKTIRVAWSYMRGEDDMLPVCKRHFDMAESNWSRCRAHMMTKDKFINPKVSA